ncbi:hypothetical protein B5C34_05150 [Pacificimonas flava]|uniref:Uncharacterized protein n=2 Tax=Pacificimonas TaxID=1960290 RepID=A0A219B557_9SPHN|nr:MULTISPECIES: glycosyl hydrolase 108 family protein [Pacificimonas]MBZ6377395.1 hypothetical protein [Pacificimonas aurantium]OWV32898.1 hypothetical protein B5C34_05150 [Pacificimonas flava]
MTSLQNIIDGVIERERGFVDHPDDPGGATKYGITERNARLDGYEGDMRDLPRSRAHDIYYRKYVVAPGFDRLLEIMPRVCAEVVDSGVNAGPGRSARWLQQGLNLLNRKGRDFADLVVDGDIGPKTRAALAELKARRGAAAEELLVRTLDGLQFRHYAEITERDPGFESFFVGWILHRIQNA